MSIKPRLPAETDLERIDGLLADLGTLKRRAGSETLTEEDFLTLAGRMRGRLLDLRRSLEDEPAPIELTDVAQAVATASRIGQSPELQALIRRIPGLMTAQQLAGHPEVRRARVYGGFAAIDGGRT